MKKIVCLKQCNKAADAFFGALNSLSLSHLLLNNFFKKQKSRSAFSRSGIFVFIEH